MLVQRQLNTFSGCEDIQDHYVAWFDTENGILHHVSSKYKNAISVSENKDGYLYIQPTKLGGKTRKVKLHRIACEFFHGAPTLEKFEVNHKNHNRKDNRASNLEWVSHAENTTLDPIWLATRVECSTPISITLDSNTTRYLSCKEAMRALGYQDTRGLPHSIRPLLKGEADSVTFYNRKLGKQVTVTLPK